MDFHKILSCMGDAIGKSYFPFIKNVNIPGLYLDYNGYNVLIISILIKQ